MSFELRETYVGQEVTILTEKQNSEESLTVGHTENFLRVLVPGVTLNANLLIKVLLTGNNPEGLIGKVLNETN